MTAQMETEQQEKEEENTETQQVEAAKEEEESEIGKWKKKMREKGIVLVDAYHCQRCDYVWLPRDFSIGGTYNVISDDRLLRMTPPKVCARCKSKQWNLPPKRKTKHIFDCTCGEKHHDMFTTKNVRAAYRRYVRDIAEQDKRIKYLEEFAKKKGIRLEKE